MIEAGKRYRLKFIYDAEDHMQYNGQMVLVVETNTGGEYPICVETKDGEDFYVKEDELIKVNILNE